MSDAESDVDLPSLEVCEERIARFVAVTGTDEALAQMRLQENGWSLEMALEEHLREIPASKSEVAASTKAPEHISIVTWNIDGLSEKNIVARTKAICGLIEQDAINVVFLQEVVKSTLAIIKELLPHYQCLCEENDNYFTAILLRRFTIYLDSFQTEEFPSSKMGRNLMTADCHVGKAKFCLLNTHLESTKEHTEERMRQVKICFQKALEQSDEKTVIFGGDLNLRDKELEQMGNVPTGLDDLWIRMGGRKECQYTWDMTRNTNLEFPGRFKPRCRFDRLYVRDSDPLQFTPEHFGLFGIERVPNTQSFPSDHWAIIAGFKVNSN